MTGQNREAAVVALAVQVKVRETKLRGRTLLLGPSTKGQEEPVTRLLLQSCYGESLRREPCAGLGTGCPAQEALRRLTLRRWLIGGSLGQGKKRGGPHVECDNMKLRQQTCV